MSQPPSIQLSSDGVTWQTPGAPLSVSASASFFARLNSTANVDSTVWAVLSTDDVGTAPALTPSGIVNSQVTGTAGAAGTAFILQATINGGIDKTTGKSNPATTTTTARVGVPTSVGLQVICFDEHAEAGAQWWLPFVNAAIRGAGNASGGNLSLFGTSVTIGANGSHITLNSTGVTVVGPGGSVMETAGGGTLGFYGATPVVQASRSGQLTDSTGGTPGTTLAAITAGSSYSQADMVAVKNALASLAAKHNAIDTLLHNLGLSS